MASTTSPNVRPIPTWDTLPPATSLMMMAPVPAKARENVPKNSAASFFMNGLLLVLPRRRRRLRSARRPQMHAAIDQDGFPRHLAGAFEQPDGGIGDVLGEHDALQRRDGLVVLFQALVRIAEAAGEPARLDEAGAHGVDSDGRAECARERTRHCVQC